MFKGLLFCIKSVCGSLYFFLSAAGESFSDDGWVRLWSLPALVTVLWLGRNIMPKATLFFLKHLIGSCLEFQRVSKLIVWCRVAEKFMSWSAGSRERNRERGKERESLPNRSQSLGVYNDDLSARYSGANIVGVTKQYMIGIKACSTGRYCKNGLLLLYYLLSCNLNISGLA